MSLPDVLIVSTKIRPGAETAFIDWQVRHDAALAASPGFTSSETRPIGPAENAEWQRIIHFRSDAGLRAWQDSAACAELFSQTSPFALHAELKRIPQEELPPLGSTVTEVIFSKVLPGLDDRYRAWSVRIQMAQAKFPGYRGMYLQPPISGQGKHWTTLLHFDTTENLLAWKNAPERARLLDEARTFIDSEELLPLGAAFPGWVPVNPATGESPPNWKTALLVLLGLYPIVVLELRFLNPFLISLNPAFGTFLGNILSVAATTFLTMPLCVRSFAWWLFLDKKSPPWITPLGVGVLTFLFLCEITLLWRLFP